MSSKTTMRRTRKEKTDELLQNVLATLDDKTRLLEKKVLSDTQASLTVNPQEVRQVADTIKSSLDGTIGETVVGVDLLNNRYELIYYFWSLTRNVMIEVRTQLGGEAPAIDTIADVFPGLDWHEREIHEMFGIKFNGHPNLGLLILPDELEGQYPLRKNFQVSRDRLKESGIIGSVAKASKTSGSRTSAEEDESSKNE